MATRREATQQQFSKLSKNETFWRDHQVWLQDCGYTLRSRYRPDWIPSWTGTSKFPMLCEDGICLDHDQIIDAVRTSDGQIVVLKKVSKSVHPHEVEIGNLFSSDSLATDPRNHCIPIFQTIDVPDEEDLVLIVMPLLRPYDKPRFETIGEVVECFRQLFEGLQFMHQHHVANRDCNQNNIMMEPSQLFPQGFHPVEIDRNRDWNGPAKYHNRTQRPPKYYFIDFGISRVYNPDDGLPLEEPIWGGDKSVPEFQKSDAPCNPFPTDVYYLGNVIRLDFLQGDTRFGRLGKFGFEFMDDLVSDMVNDDPARRPTMDEVVSRFEVIRKKLGWWKLHSRVADRREPATIRGILNVVHWTRRIGLIVRRVPPVPIT